MFAQPALSSFVWATDIEDGWTTCGAYPVDAGTPALQYLQRVVASEQALCYVAQGGEFTFKGRYNTSSVSNLEFRHRSSGGASSPKVNVWLTGIGARGAFEDLVNRVVSATEPDPTAGAAGTVYVNDDAASITAVNRVVSLDLTDLLCDTDFQADAIGKLVLDRFGGAEFRVTSVDTVCDLHAEATWDQILAADIGDTCRVVFWGPSTLPEGTLYDETLRIEGIVSSVDAAEGVHRMRFYLSPDPVNLSGLFTLGTSALDGSDVLAY
jgi:hypothetical protein